ncbi:DNA-directed RNA polymerase III subunit RPC7, partial [Tremellales sp. Uapishka_1]
MSRGGFRGRGRGRGGDGPRNPFAGSFGTMSQNEIAESLANRNKHSGMLFPPLEDKDLSYLPEPSQFEDAIVDFTIGLNKIFENGIPVNGETTAPWRIAGERKVVGIEIESYSDQFRKATHSSITATGTLSTKLDPKLLRMQESLFPPSLWKEYFEGPTIKKEKGTKKRKYVEGEERDDEKDEEEVEKSDADKSSDEDFDFDEDDSDQDYDHNYFDNGEEDDDSGGDDGGDDGGGMNDD